MEYLRAAVVGCGECGLTRVQPDPPVPAFFLANAGGGGPVNLASLGAMIRDPQARSEIAQEWTAVRKLCASSHRQWRSSGGSFIIETPPESLYNLPFLLAYAVLDQVLGELIVRRPQPQAGMHA